MLPVESKVRVKPRFWRFRSFGEELLEVEAELVLEGHAAATLGH
jgi:hypothetical protein